MCGGVTYRCSHGCRLQVTRRIENTTAVIARVKDGAEQWKKVQETAKRVQAAARRAGAFVPGLHSESQTTRLAAAAVPPAPEPQQQQQEHQQQPEGSGAEP